MSNRNDAHQVSKEYKRFRILLIGRANSGKTTILKHISNTSDNSEQPVYHKYPWRPSIKPTDERGIHDINQSFHFPSNPHFVFHDSPGFETGDETQLKQVQEFIRKRSKAYRTDRQLHAIWFCLVTNASRPLLALETKFFNEERAGNVPVIAIFTKFDDLITQVYDPELGLQENRHTAEEMLETRFREPVSKSAFPPNACLSMEDMHRSGSSSLRHNQITKLMKETAKCLDSLTLKKLFVSIQRNNLELCLELALESIYEDLDLPEFMGFKDFNILFEDIFSWFPHLPTSSKHASLAFQKMGFFKHFVKFITFDSESSPAYRMFRMEFPDGSAKLSLAECIALLMCAENSFWHCSSGLPFYEAVQKSFKVYKDSESRRIIETALQDDNIYTNMSQIVLGNRLPRPIGIDI